MPFKKLLLLTLTPFLCFAKAGYFEPWGKDSDLKISAKEELPVKPKSIAVDIAEKIINFHQQVISPVDGPRSHYRPGSSEYMRIAMKNHGFIKGFVMGCDRLLRENKDPWVYRSIEENGEQFKYDPPRE
ncbi:MAG: membrane protein insertion efficiency factor YidD [Chlamydiae bacterium]|nr:membrane protein insertion efficiency factor YidD [Chlamydiota bacterium]